ncbi:disks large-associated protein 1 [Caerostris extrusa]|uniref:Disks large-associated protein 1 n=1 Tax=Caerostris extrusa TaxID=172846 RepID=A0AAV4SVN4_CAEEX|nr:disks large-associated protein 1 [Caerostris extrusa]
MNLRKEIKNKPHSASFTNLQISESFQHFRSVSYFEAVTNVSLSGSHKSFESNSCMEKSKGKRPEVPACPVSFENLGRSFIVSSSEGKNPWIVIEFAPRDDPDVSSNSDRSDHSIELAVKSKVQHFTSLKDLSDNPGNDVCNCALSNSRRDSTPKCNLNSFSASKNSINFDGPNKYKSEGSIFFHLSPRRRLENLKHMLKNFSKRASFAPPPLYTHLAQDHVHSKVNLA